MKTASKLFVAIFMVFSLFVITAVVVVQMATQTARRAIDCAVGLVVTPVEWVVDFFGGGDGIDEFLQNLKEEQLHVAGIIIGVGKARGRDEKDIKTALMVGLQESGLRNLPYGDRDSLGVFQQRPSQGWGTPEQLLDPVYAANKFFEALEKVGDRGEKSYLDIALAVQRPSVEAYLSPGNFFPGKERYADALYAQAKPGEASAAYGTVTLVGDSLTAATSPYDPQNMELFGWETVIVDGLSSRRTLFQPESGTPESGLNAIKRLRTGSTDPGTWIIALGTNDVSSVQRGTDPETIIRPILDELGPDTEVLWVNLHVPKYQQGVDLFNGALLRLTGEYPHLKVADWESVATLNPGWLQADGVHYTVEGSKQRSSFVAGASRMLKVVNSTKVVGGESSGSGGVCDRGRQFISSVTGTVTSKVGTVVQKDDPILAAGGIAAWAYGQSGLEVGASYEEALKVSTRIALPDDALRGDIVYWATDPEDAATVYQTGMYMGSNQVILDPKPGEEVRITPIDWEGVFAILRPKTTASAGTAGTAPDAPVESISNPGLAQVALNFESIVGGRVYYGASRPKWVEMGRKGNFGHGSKQLWLDNLLKGPEYYSLDCSGFVNMVVFLAYGVDVTGCSSDYINFVVDGQQLTKQLMHGTIDPALLRPGDLIVKDSRPCNSDPDDIGHIVMVIGVQGTVITTAESAAGSDGFRVTDHDVSWFNTNWTDLVVSRWVGPGAVSA